MFVALVCYVYRPIARTSRGGSRSRDWRGPYGERGAVLCPQRGPGAEPLVRGQGGEAPLKLNAFWCCYMSEMALNCYVYMSCFMVNYGSCSTNMCARQLRFNSS